MIDMTANHDAWQALADDLSKDRPSIGKTVTVTSGKNKGFIGTVFFHGIDKFADWRYCSEAQMHLREMAGRWGYRVGIRNDDGEKIFVSAEKVAL